MKTTSLRLICALFLLPFFANAQEKIIKAFDAIIDCKDATIMESHSLERDPATSAKTGQCDIYSFTLPEDKIGLIKSALKAFREDNERAYSISSGTTAKRDSEVILAVGDGKRNVTVSSPDHSYIYSCFLAQKSEDPDGNYRYAYGMNYRVKDGHITGKLFVTYALTLKVRQDRAISSSMGGLNQLTQLTMWADMLDDYDDDDEDSGKGRHGAGRNSWFRDIMKYVQAMGSASAGTRTALATKIYEVTKQISNYKNVSEQDKNTAREILKTLIADKRMTEVTVQLLTAALNNIK